MTIDGQSESQNGYPVEIKDLEADPRTRWCDDLIQYVGPTWSHTDRGCGEHAERGSSLGRSALTDDDDTLDVG